MPACPTLLGAIRRESLDLLRRAHRPLDPLRHGLRATSNEATGRTGYTSRPGIMSPTSGANGAHDVYEVGRDGLLRV